MTPLIGVWHDGAMHFTTGPTEQKYRNLEHGPKVALTTGSNTWATGLDVVVEGEAVRVTDNAELQRIADAIEAKYGSVWHFDVARRDVRRRRARGGGVPDRAAKVMAFAKDPHGQTTFRLDPA